MSQATSPVPHLLYLLSLRLQYALQYGYTLSVGYCFGESDLYYTPFNGYVPLYVLHRPTS